MTAVVAAAPELAPTARDATDRVRAAFEQTRATLVANLMGMALIVPSFWSLAPRAHLLGWVLLAALLFGLRLAHFVRYRRQPDAGADTIARWRKSWRVLVFAQGALWPLAVWLFWGLGSPYHMLLPIIIVNAYTMGSVQLLALHPRMFMAFIVLVWLPVIVRVATDTSQPWHWQFALVLLLVFGANAVLGRTYRDALARAIELKRQTENLAEQLKREKAAADAARRVAETASRAKTQFFAAASHDLRQPLHAMGLFAEALRERTRNDPEVISLVTSINESVDALEGLFAELLDLTRIDTGGVEVSPAPIRVRDLFARLKLHFEPVAFEKGLDLSFHGAQRVLHSDPLLVERIVRNLLSNAIRYTEDGGVLVACRPKPGDAGRCLLQVWDTGVGIDAANLPHVFDEFYQVQRDAPLAAGQKKGLGLGLAIVKRLADLLEAPLSVRSVPRRGTVFTLELPVGREPRTIGPPPGSGAASLGIALNGRRILIVEDEPAVREGLTVLLASWGALVEALPDVEALEAWCADSQRAKPDLVIVDYRLPGGRTGIEAITAVRARWPGAALPAIVATGSSMGGHEQEAAQHDFHLLIKPVVPAKLRAMIGFKLNGKPGAGAPGKAAR